MTWRIVHIHQSEKMKLKLDNLLVVKQKQEITIPLGDISVIVVEGGDTVITTRLLSALSKYNISLIICDTNHLPTGLYCGLNVHFRAYKRAVAQIKWQQEMKDLLWQYITYFKIDNQQDVLILLNKSDNAIELLSHYKQNVQLGDKTNREGHAAKVYFNELFGMNFTRVTQQEADAVNAGLNYGYAILRAQMARIVVGYGLNPLFGLFHKNEYNQFNLVDDLMEPFRPIIDLWAFLHLRESTYLTYDHRLSLTDLLNAKIKYGKELCTVSTAMDKYVKGFLQFIENGDASKFYCPIVSSIEMECSNEV